MRTILAFGLTALAAAALGIAPVSAFTLDDADITVTTYQVAGNTLAEIERSMAERGPNGFWAYTTWNVNWTGGCALTVKAEIIMPELGPDTNLSASDIAEFARMTEALYAHEMLHVENGVAAADEVESQGCPTDTSDIFATYNQADIDLDAETDHGFTQGVYLDAE